MLRTTRVNQFRWFTIASSIGLLLAAGCALPSNFAHTRIEPPARTEILKEQGNSLLHAAADVPMARAQSEAGEEPAPQPETSSTADDHTLSIADLEALALANNP